MTFLILLHTACHTPDMNLDHEDAPQVSLPTDCYIKAHRGEEEQRLKETCKTMTAIAWYTNSTYSE